MIQPGVYIAKKRPGWASKSLRSNGGLILVISIYKDFVSYTYVGESGTRKHRRELENFLECEPVPASELLKELL